MRSTSRHQLDPGELDRVLKVATERDFSKSYRSVSLSPTPPRTVNPAKWIQCIETLPGTISAGDRVRQEIAKPQYWQDEAEYFESCFVSHFKGEIGQVPNWDGELKKLRAEHTGSFFRRHGLSGLEQTYKEIAKEPEPQADIAGRVFWVAYYRHRSRYWERLCNERGYAFNRLDIQSEHYWRTEYVERLGDLQVTEKPRQRKHAPKGNRRPRSPTIAKPETKTRSRIEKRYNLRTRRL